MVIFFRPAMLFANRLKFRSKFIVLTALCAIPLTFGANLLIREAQQLEARTRYEVQAIQYLAPLRQLSVDIAQTRGTTHAFLSGDSSFKTRIESLSEQVNQH